MRLNRRKLVTGYIRVTENTDNGRQHLHMIFRGSYIEQKYLSYLWAQIHNSPVVDIRAVRSRYRDKKRVANYLAKYMTKEVYRRYSWSWGWVYKGFVKTWKLALKHLNDFQWFHSKEGTFPRFLGFWKDHLRGKSDPIGFIAFLILECSLARRQRQAKPTPW